MNAAFTSVNEQPLGPRRARTCARTGRNEAGANRHGFAPGQRGSIELWEKVLAPAGIHLHWAPFESERLREILYTPGHTFEKAAEMARGYVERMRLLRRLDDYDAVFVYREAARRHLEAGQSLMFVTSHLCNWEWLLHGMALQLGYPVDAAYKPLHDQWAERLMLKIRSRFGARLVPAKELLADFLKRRGIVRALAMNADQAPVSTDKRYWTQFLGQDTAFYVGADQIARATRLPVLYVSMRRIRRGYYEADLQPLWDGREVTEPNTVTERYARACEIDVFKSPADWLWSYRRWRLKKPLYGSD